MMTCIDGQEIEHRLNSRELWPDPSWDGWRDVWLIAQDAYSTDEEKARGLVATVNAYIEAGAPEVVLPTGEEMPPEYFDHIEIWEIADELWAWNEETAYLAVRALRWAENVSGAAADRSKKKPGKRR
jgi:hypothetical protein